jgi:hypothetical protein
LEGQTLFTQHMALFSLLQDEVLVEVQGEVLWQ